jgi:hypothetical protein
VITKRRRRIAIALASLADCDDTPAGDKVRAALSKRDRDYGMKWFDALAEHEHLGWMHNGRWRGLNHETASMLLSNRVRP